MNVALLIYTCLYNSWTETNPPLSSIVWKYDEFDPKSPSLQILLENLPERSVWVDRGTYRVEHKVKITIYMKLIHYNISSITDYKTTWFNTKQEINRILAINKYNISDINNLDLPGGWDDKETIAVGRGVKIIREPIVWQSEQVVTAVYYIGGTLTEE